MVEATLILGGLGAVRHILGVAARKFAIDKDPKMEEICGALGLTVPALPGCMV